MSKPSAIVALIKDQKRKIQPKGLFYIGRTKSLNPHHTLPIPLPNLQLEVAIVTIERKKKESIIRS